MKLRQGTLGLKIAIDLYGQDVILSYGDWLTPGIVIIPDDEVETFKSIVEEERIRLKL